MLNEAGNAAPLIAEIIAALKAYPSIGENFEIVCVDDGSEDSTAAEVKAVQVQDKRVRLIRHSTRLGMSAAIRNGVRQARSIWVMTCDGDRQNDPADAPRLCDLGWAKGLDRRVLVAGIRVNRQDTQGKRIANKMANFIRRSLLNDNCPDTGCSLKLFRRESYLELPFFNGLHRFMPALFKHYGLECIFTPVKDRRKGRFLIGFYRSGDQRLFRSARCLVADLPDTGADRGREEFGSRHIPKLVRYRLDDRFFR